MNNEPIPGSYSCSCLNGFTGSHCDSVRLISTSACPVLVLMGQLVWMAFINMTASVLIGTPVRIIVIVLLTLMIDCLDMVNGFNCTCITGYTE